MITEYYNLWSCTASHNYILFHLLTNRHTTVTLATISLVHPLHGVFTLKVIAPRSGTPVTDGNISSTVEAEMCPLNKGQNSVDVHGISDLTDQNHLIFTWFYKHFNAIFQEFPRLQNRKFLGFLRLHLQELFVCIIYIMFCNIITIPTTQMVVVVITQLTISINLLTNEDTLTKHPTHS